MDLADLQAECARLLSDVGNNRWSTDVLTTRINLAQTEIQGYTNAVKTQTNYSTVAGSSNVTITTSVMNVLNAWKLLPDGSIRPLYAKTFSQLDYQSPDWRQWPDGEPIYFVVQATASTIQLVPAPDANFAGAYNIILVESRQPADLVNPTDIPFDSTSTMIPYHYTIVHWVVAHCFMDDGTPEAFAKSKFHRSGNMMNPGEYEKQIGRIMAQFDVPEDVPSTIMWKPQGGRLGYVYYPSKSFPFLY